MNVDNTREVITRIEISERIEELRDGDGTWSIVRQRTGEIIKDGFEDEGTARDYIDREDLNPDRIIAQRGELDSDDARRSRELSELSGLNDDANACFDGWRDGSTALYRYSFFDSAWARQQAAEELGCSTDATRYWPFNTGRGIDWNEAATERRDSRYAAVEFGGVEYYGENNLYANAIERQNRGAPPCTARSLSKNCKPPSSQYHQNKMRKVK